MTSIVNDAKGVAHTFSSWDTCMTKAYCKWPVIAAIIVAGIIVLSILWCLFSCLCCGITLCNACVQCATCCGCCGACGNKSGRGGGSRNKDTEYQPMPPTPTPYQGYQPQPSPMVYNGGQQFATFDASSKSGTKINHDALPHMPSWSNATTRQVQVEDHANPEGHDMEMDRIQPHSQPALPSQRARGAYSQLPPSSPTRDTYHQAHAQPYASDIGAQRLQPQQTNNYDEFQDTPLSPAPTYYSTVPPAGTYRRQPQSVASPPPAPQSHYSSTVPYPSTRESTLFEAQSSHNSYASRSVSPPSQPSYSPYQTYQPPQQHESQGARPPSLLMVGRKPVAGSFREV